MRPPPADPNLLAICFENLNHSVVRSNASQDVPGLAWGASRAGTNKTPDKTPKTFSRSSGVGKPTNHQLFRFQDAAASASVFAVEPQRPGHARTGTQPALYLKHRA